MKSSITYDKELGLCITRVSGAYNRLNDSQKLFKNTCNFGANHSCSLFLFDMREATIIGGPIEVLYTVSNPEKVGFRRHYRIAAVYSINVGQHKLMETVAQNRGYNFRVFSDMDEAIAFVTAK